MAFLPLTYSLIMINTGGIRIILVPSGFRSEGSTVIDTNNICIYDRIIDVYEENDLAVKMELYILMVCQLPAIPLKWTITG
jgi:hypothetical protein